MEIYRKHILDKFQEHLRKNYIKHCERHEITPTDDQLLTFLIDQNLMSMNRIQQYTVIKEFERLYPQQDNHKTQTVLTLADRFSISERTVWNILKNSAKPFDKLDR